MADYPRELNIQFFKTNRWITGAGEEAIPQVPPAILSAVFKITGKRIRTMPMAKDADLSWA
jgi:CO/xanthine dehydrogenase Mo-binding subunit